jgi:homogentisate 1,2-dioxygenase
MNKLGQATLMAPVVETEIDVPKFHEPIDKKGEYILYVKHNGGNVTAITLSHHPFDIAGWEGTFYPFGFHIDNHHGVSREIHTAPPMRQTFQSGDGNSYGFSICSFKSQMEGWHPKDIPAPYAHSNVDSDEVLFFASSNYTAREGVIGEGSITLHPSSIPHSPHGDAALRSMKERAKVSNMLAVMLDTFFEDLFVTEIGYEYRDKEYALSWYKAGQVVSGKR